VTGREPNTCPNCWEHVHPWPWNQHACKSLGAGKPAGTSPVAKGSDPQGWPTQVAYPSEKNLTPDTTAAQESSSDQPVVNARGVATATGPGEAT
jgi:hypothetical protein